jgi:xylulokinase
MSYMGLDIGQTGCKAAVFDDQGGQLAVSYREYPTLVPRPGWAELDSDQVVQRCFEVIREAAGACGEEVRTLGISSQGEAFTPVDGNGNAIGNAMITFDTRSSGITETWSSEFGVQNLYRITGHTAHPMFSLFKLLWIRENRPEVFSKTDKFLCFEDLLHYRLGLRPRIAWCLAGRTMLFDIRTHQWDWSIMDAVGLEKSRLSEPVPSGQVLEALPVDVARGLGLPREVLVVSGGHDQPMGALGAGVVAEGTAIYATGTSEAVTPAFPSPIQNKDLRNANICTYDYIIPGMYTTVVFSFTGGNILRWFRDQWGERERREAAASGRDAYEILLENMEETPSPVMVLPYFTPAGTPYFDADVCGAILGLHLSTTRSQVLRALLEGVAFEMRLNLDILNRAGMGMQELRAIGGGARSRAWMQLKADVLNMPVTRVKVTEAAGFASAMLGCAALTEEPVASIAQRWVSTLEELVPDPERAEFYTERFDQYRKLYPTLKPLGDLGSPERNPGTHRPS